MLIRVGFVVYRRRWVLGGTETLVECNRMCGIEGKGRDIASEPSLLEVDNPFDVLVEFVR